MRPIDKGNHPLTPKRKLKQRFNNWKKAIPILKERTGSYCHLCEMKVVNALAIEHFYPRKHFPDKEADWDNFLLTCNYCNSSKTDKQPKSPVEQHYLLPHLHNTLIAFKFTKISKIIPNTLSLNTRQQTRAKATIELYELDKVSTNEGNADTRWLERAEALKMAIDCRIEYQQNQINENAIIRLARTQGFFSIWYRIFQDIPSVKKKLVDCPDFHLNKKWFDTEYNPLKRNSQDI